MSFSATTEFLNKKVKTWALGDELPIKLDEFCVRLSVEPYEDNYIPFPEYFKKFVESCDISGLDTLLIGSWGEPYDDTSKLVVDSLVEHSQLFTKLKHLFIGDLQLEESEVSWIQQSDISRLYDAFASLKTLKIRGGEGLSLNVLKHQTLERLIIETGGMDKSIIEQINRAELPNLSHLELWLGDEDYGCNIETADIKALLGTLNNRFPKITHLGLCNYYQSDDLAELISENGIPTSITTLDLSKGNLSDRGAQALLNSDKLSHLITLDLHHHYLSNSMMDKLSDAKLAPNVDLNDQNVGDEDDGEIYRYIFVAE